MNAELVAQLQTAQEELDPRFKALRAATGSLKKAVKLADEETLDALAMQKALVKLEESAALVESEELQVAVAAFAAQTREGLDALAFEFARDLKHVFEERGQTVEGRPPMLVVGELILQIDIPARKAQWFYGKEALTKPIPLSINAIIKAYDRQEKAIVQRDVDISKFVAELYQAWRDSLAKRTRATSQNRISIVETYAQLTLNRQGNRFWNSPARNTFKDYPRPFFVRDLVLAQDAPTIMVDGKRYHLRLGVASKNQAESAMRSMWLPRTALDGDYYGDVKFEEE